MLRNLIIAAGIDPSGRAGLAVDLATARDFSVEPSFTVTAFTIQPERGAHRIFSRDPLHLKEEFAHLFADVRSGVIKIGMIPDESTVRILSNSLQSVPNLIRVLDPILFSSRGHRLITARGFKSLQTSLLPGSILTPNLREAEAISGMAIRSDVAREIAATRILNMGAAAVIIKGGHSAGNMSDDLVATSKGLYWLRGRTALDAKDRRSKLRGTGCRFSTALAACMSRGMDLLTSAKKSKRYVLAALGRV